MNPWLERVKQWETVFEATDEEEDDETEEERKAGREMWDPSMQASSWWYDRQCSTSPLTARPRLWFWNTGLSIHACGDNRQQRINHISAWTEHKGHLQLTRAQFLDEVQAFHDRLLAEMASRIQERKDTDQPERTDRAPEPAAFAAARAGSKKRSAPLPQRGVDPEERFWPHPDIAVNLAKLEEEQQERFPWLASSWS